MTVKNAMHAIVAALLLLSGCAVSNDDPAQSEAQTASASFEDLRAGKVEIPGVNVDDNVAADESLADPAQSPDVDKANGRCTHIQYCTDPRFGGGVTCIVDNGNCLVGEVMGDCTQDSHAVCGRSTDWARICDRERNPTFCIVR